MFKHFKGILAFIAVAAVSPIILGKLGFWESSHANNADASKSVEPTSSSTPTPGSYAAAIARATPAVVSIHSTRSVPKELNPMLRDPVFRYFFGADPHAQIPQEMQTGLGSGVLVTKDGYILTNNHVITNSDEITVKLNDGRSMKAKVIGRDPETDLAILKINLSNLPVISIGNSDKLQQGDIVFAIGNPFGVGQTVTHGIISGTQRTNLGISTFEGFIQTDAAMNPGSSGGALIDMHGNLIGINNAIYTRTGGFQGISFAIPINSAKEVMNQLIHQGHVTRGWLGISLSPLTDDIRKSLNYPKGEGAVIAGVIRGSPAHQSGLRPGDIIISVNNKEITTTSDVLSITANLKSDTAYPLAVVRNGETLDFRVVVGKRPVHKETASENNASEE